MQKPFVKYTPEIGELICDRVSTHTCGIKGLCKKFPDMPSEHTIYEWRKDHPEFAQKFAVAKLRQADLLAEEIIDIADDDSRDIRTNEDGKPVLDIINVHRSRLRIDTRKWLVGKLLPRQYGQYAEDKKNSSESLVEKLDQKLDD